MSRRRIIAFLCVASTIAVIVLIVAVLPRDQPIKVLYVSYSDYYGGPFGPRQVELQVVSRSRMPIRVWAPCRVEFKTGKAVPQTATKGGVTLPRANLATDVQITLTGNERGTWRVLVPVSNYAIVDRLESWIGRGAVVNFADSLLQRFPRWVPSDWMEELPQRLLNPPAVASQSKVGDDQ